MRRAQRVRPREKRRQEALKRALERAEAKFRSAFENAVEGIFQTTPDGHYLYANPALARMYGYEKASDLLAGISDIGTQIYVDAERRSEFKRRLAEKDSVSAFESQIRRRDGTVIWISEHARAVRDARGRLLYYEGTVQDVSERKRAEEALARQVAETQEAYDRLRAAEEQIVQHEKLSAVGMLVAGLAHELNNPLTGILGFAELLSARPSLEPVVRSHLEHIARAGARAKAIVAKLTTFAGLHKPDRTWVDVNAIVESTLEHLVHEVGIARVSFAAELDPRLPEAWLDVGQISQVLANLCTNAIQAMTGIDGRGSLRLQTSRAADGMIEIRVIDNGPGIADGVKSKVFDPFYTTRDVGQGTGLGLSIAFRIVEEHGGHIRVIDSEPGPGATFVVTLPVGDEAAAAEEDQPDAPAPRAVNA
ncbi:MAG: ATP-binding protein [bacterium]